MLIVDQRQSRGYEPAASRNAVDAVNGIGDARPGGHVLVGDQQRVVRLAPVGEGGSVQDRFLTVPPNGTVRGIR